MPPVIVLAMHGMPPVDFPKAELAELSSLHARLKHASEAERAKLAPRHEELDAQIRAWPRSEKNDLFHASSHELARAVSTLSGCPVILGFNEFASPALDEALRQAAGESREVLVITTMLMRGGAHSEHDIPAAIQKAEKAHPEVRFRYLWPLNADRVAEFLVRETREAFSGILPATDGKPVPR